MRTTIEVLEADNSALRDEIVELKSELQSVRDFYNPGELVAEQNISCSMIETNRFDVLREDSADFPDISKCITKSKSRRLRSRNRRAGGRSSQKRRVLVMADSHGKDLGPLLYERLGHSFQSTVITRPGAPFNSVAKDIEELSNDFNFNDRIIIIGGTNDIVESTDQRYSLNLNAVRRIANRTNVAVATIPFRYDRPLMNRNVNFVNEWLKKEIKSIDNVDIIDLGIFSINYYTNHGLHLNKRIGKKKLAEIMVENILSKDMSTNLENNVGLDDVCKPNELFISSKNEDDDPRCISVNKKDYVSFTSTMHIVLENVPRDNDESVCDMDKNEQHGNLNTHNLDLDDSERINENADIFLD
jgi:hypothetical protein